MALVSAANNIQTAVIGTEHSLTQQTGIGIYVLVVDTTEMLAGDTLVLRIKTICRSGGTSNTAYTMTFSDAQAEPNKYSIPVPINLEIICTLHQTAGTGRSFPWSLLRA